MPEWEFPSFTPPNIETQLAATHWQGYYLEYPRIHEWMRLRHSLGPQKQEKVFNKCLDNMFSMTVTLLSKVGTVLHAEKSPEPMVSTVEKELEIDTQLPYHLGSFAGSSLLSYTLVITGSDSNPRSPGLSEKKRMGIKLTGTSMNLDGSTVGWTGRTAGCIARCRWPLNGWSIHCNRLTIE